MKLRGQLVSFAFFLAVILIDQASKYLAPESAIFYNDGFIWGSMADLPQYLRVITLCSVGGFIFTVYLFLLAILPKNLMGLKVGLGIFCGGIFGNILDRTFIGRTIDFIPLHLNDLAFYFNIADVFQWVGAAIVTYKLIRKEKIIWYPDNQRGRFLVLWRDQVYLASKVTLSCLCCALLLGLFSYTFLRSILIHQNVSSDLLYSFSVNFVMAFISLALLFAVLIFVIGIYLSHKLSGPLYGFELYVEDLLKGSDRVLTLREGDQSKHLEKIANDLREHFLRKPQ